MSSFTIDRSTYDDAANVTNEYVATPGISETLVKHISTDKNEPDWILKKRLQGLKLFKETTLPTWGPDLTTLDLDNITYYVKPGTEETTKWEDVPEEIRNVAERIGVPEAERNALGGTGFQFDCLTEDTLVYTNPRGPVKIKNIAPNDTVFSYDELSNQIVKNKVRAVINKGKRKVFEVTIAGRKIKTTANHPFLAIVNEGKKDKQRARFAKKWKHLTELKPGDVIHACIGFDKYSEYLSKDWMDDYIKRRVKKRIRLRVIAPFSEDAILFQQKDTKELRETVIIPKKEWNFSGDLEIYGNKVAIISYPENCMSVIIELKEIPKAKIITTKVPIVIC